MAEQDFVTRIPDLSGPAWSRADSEVDHAVQSYDDVVAHILRQLREAGLPAQGKVYAIYLLGQWRATASVSTLLENISLTAPRSDPRIGIARWGTYPAQEALARIGSPAVNMILDSLPAEQDQLRRKLMCYVIHDVEGKNLGRLILQSRLANESDGGRRANLQAALDIISAL